VSAGPVAAASTDHGGGESAPEAPLERQVESQQERLRELEREMQELRSSVPFKPGKAESQGEEEPLIRFGGALRFNYGVSDYQDAVRDRGGDAGLELFRINVDGSKQGFLFSAEYRWYPYQDVLHHGWAGYDLDDGGQLQVGVTKVPFGLLPYAAHNYWFGIPYYVGLADDYDLGAKYLWRPGAWDLQLAFFKNPEVSGATSLERYAFDVVEADLDGDGSLDSRNRETNQANLRAAYTLGQEGACPAEVGVSGQWGQLYNAASDDFGSRWAAAAHLDLRCGRWNLQLQAGRQVMDPASPAGADDRTVSLGALATAYGVASEANLGVVNLAYNFPSPWQAIDLLTCYNDFSIYAKDEAGFRDSRINTTGCAVGAGPLFIYADVITAENAPFFSNADPLGAGEEGWDTRFNLNLGYYF
jgi:hypothetical protein